MEEVFQTLVTNMASFAQNVNIQTTATNERIVQLSQQLAQQSAKNQQQLTQSVERFVAQDVARRPALKIEPPTFNGKGDLREWKHKLELCYEAKVLTNEEKLVWTLNLLQDGASRVVNQARPADYATLMRDLTRRYTDGNDEFHYRNALSENRQTGSIEDYVDRFLDLSSRVQTYPLPRPNSP